MPINITRRQATNGKRSKKLKTNWMVGLNDQQNISFLVSIKCFIWGHDYCEEPIWNGFISYQETPLSPYYISKDTHEVNVCRRCFHQGVDIFTVKERRISPIDKISGIME